MKTNTHGFTVMFVIILSAVVSSLGVVLIAYKRIIDTQLKMNIIKYKFRLSEDVIRTQVYLSMSDSKTLAEFVSAIKKQASEFSLDLAHSACSGAACRVKLANPEFLPNENDATKVILRYQLPSDFKISNLNTSELKIEINNIPDFSSGQSKVLGHNSVSCNDISKPVFVGTKIENDQLVAICDSIKPPNSSQIVSNLSANKHQLTITCPNNSGLWLKGINKDLSPACLKFPEGITQVSEIKLCPEGEFAQSYELSSELKLTKVKCQKRKAPYEFQ